ncbi:hypothetical protein NDU88_004529 [Pleurodeles waltl]|uniref:Uncharacterized protein n=1 Tax=Pleurodeles waltl TaxID=8319 RepID=A0AAV7NNQ1_PLEWA|nr:hypothetical protein NDU88_004529 [Pleurodeles waltl]
MEPLAAALPNSIWRYSVLFGACSCPKVPYLYPGLQGYRHPISSWPLRAAAPLAAALAPLAAPPSCALGPRGRSASGGLLQPTLTPLGLGDYAKAPLCSTLRSGALTRGLSDFPTSSPSGTVEAGACGRTVWVAVGVESDTRWQVAHSSPFARLLLPSLVLPLCF